MPDKPPTDGGAIQRQRGFFGRRSVLESSGAVKPPEPPRPPQPEAAPEPATPASQPDTKAGRKAARKAAARKAMAGRGSETQLRSRRRTSKVGLVLLGAAAIGVAGAWTADRWMRPSCDPTLDPACQQAKSSGSSGGGGSASRSSSSSSRSGSSGRSWFSWGDSDGGSAITGGSGSAAAVFGTTRRVEQSTIKRGGFGSIGRFFSSGG